ncbi:MAG TPA: redoxin domain-containing protein [Aggregatilineales bacterium]|nr:redoxin domain-containing protein [Aggregatilineales bacterium]
MTERPVDLYAEDGRFGAPDGAVVKKQSGIFTPFGIVIILSAVLMIAVVAWGIYDNSLSQPGEGKAPDFTAPLLGEEGSLSLADYRGQVVVINFWGSWCGPCRVEAPMLQRTYDAYKDQGVVFIGVDVKDIEQDALDYLAEFNITYPNVMDIGGKIEDDYRTQGVPETFVVNPDGEIVKFFFAQPREDELRRVIEDALDA